MADLTEARLVLDRVDRQIVELLRQRLETVAEIAKIKQEGLSLSKLESRPIPRRPWEYLFYVDLEGSLHNDHASLAVAELRRTCPYLRVLGTYPARTTVDGTVDRVRIAASNQPEGR